MNSAPRSYRDLIVWQKGIQLAKLTYRITGKFPAEERFGLTSQMRRASISVPSNLGEVQARHTTGEFIQGISHAEGSLAELDTQFVLATELGFCSTEISGPALRLIEEMRKMANTLRRKLSRPA